MKTRQASLTEKILFYGAGTLFLLIMVVSVFIISNKFNKMIKDIDDQKIQRENQKVQFNSDISRLKLEIADLEIKLEKSIKKRKVEEDEYNEILKKLKDAKKYLPQTYVKPEIMKKIMEKAVSLNIDINYFDQKRLDYINVDLMSVTFEAEIEGDYWRIKNYLSFLEKPLKIEDENSPNSWNVVLKIPYPEGVRFFRFKNDLGDNGLNEEELAPAEFFDSFYKTIKTTVEVDNPEYNPNSRNRNNSVPQKIQKTIYDEFMIGKFLSENNIYMASLDDGHMKMKINIVTFFVKKM